MKTTLLAAGILAAVCGAASAGDVYVPDAVVGKGSSASLPWAQAEIRYQALVPAALLGGKKIRISNLAFAPVTSGSFTATQLEIRMAHTTQGLSLVFDNNLQKDRTVVFSGPASWTFTANQWSDLGLTSVFNYNGADNVVVEVRFTGGQGGASFWAGVIQTYFISGAGTYNAPQGGNILLRAAPKMRLRFDEAPCPSIRAGCISRRTRCWSPASAEPCPRCSSATPGCWTAAEVRPPGSGSRTSRFSRGCACTRPSSRCSPRPRRG
jgi:hypothetical protein